MKKKIISLSLVAAMLISSLSTAGISVFADGTESTTDTGSTAVIAASDNTTTSTTKSKLDIIGDAIKEKVKQEAKKELKKQGEALVSKAIDKMTSTTASSTTASSTTASSTTASSTTASSTTTATSSTTASSNQTTKPTAVSASDLKPAEVDGKAVVKAVIKKILSKKLNPITVSQKNVTVLKGHYSYINAKAQGPISYFSTNPGVATVDKYGIIKGISQGNARVRIIAWGNLEYHPSTTYVSVNVTPSISDYLSNLFAPIYK